jgi:hypothetical protein
LEATDIELPAEKGLEQLLVVIVEEVEAAVGAESETTKGHNERWQCMPLLSEATFSRSLPL